MNDKFQVLILPHPPAIATGCWISSNSNDWGFFHTFTTNLNKLKDALSQFDNFDEKEKEIIRQRIDKILERINNSRRP